MNRTTLVRSAALALIGVCAPLASAEPWFRFHFGSGRGRPSPVVIHRTEAHRWPAPRYERCEVLPCDLHFSAYQAGDTVIIVATGTNNTAGFSTSFGHAETDHRGATLTLCNLSAQDDCAARVPTAFSVSGSFHARQTLRCVSVRVAGQCFEVPVTQTQCLS